MDPLAKFEVKLSRNEGTMQWRNGMFAEAMIMLIVSGAIALGSAVEDILSDNGGVIAFFGISGIVSLVFSLYLERRLGLKAKTEAAEIAQLWKTGANKFYIRGGEQYGKPDDPDDKRGYKLILVHTPHQVGVWLNTNQYTLQDGTGDPYGEFTDARGEAAPNHRTATIHLGGLFKIRNAGQIEPLNPEKWAPTALTVDKAQALTT